MPTKLKWLIGASSGNPRLCSVHNITVSKIAAGTVRDEDLEVPFEPGMLIVDAVQGVAYTVGSNGAHTRRTLGRRRGTAAGQEGPNKMIVGKAKMSRACVPIALFCAGFICAAFASAGGLCAAAEPTPSDAAEPTPSDAAEPTPSDAAEATPSDAAEPPKQTDEFRGRDTDDDKRLSLEELLSRQPETAHARLRQRFLTLDFDGSGDLDWEEFRKISSPPGERGTIPDPIADLARETAETWRRAFADADGDGDGALSSKEWPAERMALAAPDLADLTFQTWDRDGSGTVTLEEGAWLLDIAYGRRRPDGRPLRTASGLVLSWNYVRLLDTDRDGTLSRDEFVPKYMLGEAKNAERFSELDADRDGRLDDDEMAPAFWRDTLGEFLGLDADGDGRLTTEDLFKFGYAEDIGRRTVRACDDDGDGKLSFVEFRATTFENPTSDWFAPRLDADNDGRLSFREFYVETPPLLVAQSHILFGRFDLNKDGFLSLSEFEFQTDGLHRQIHNVYINRLNQCLPAELRRLARYSQLGDAQLAALEVSERNQIEAIADKLMRPVTDATQLRAEIGMAPHRVVRRGLLTALAAKLPETAKPLAADLELLDRRQRMAGVATHMAALDEVLLLSPSQRERLTELLAKPESDGWRQPDRLPLQLNTPLDALFSLLSGGSLGRFQVPEENLSNVLTAAQQATLNDIRRVEGQDVALARQPGKAGMAAAAAPVQAPRNVRQQRVVSHTTPMEELRRRLTYYLEQRTDVIDAACQLSPAQRGKLLLAGKLDIDRFEERFRGPPKNDQDNQAQSDNVNGVVVPGVLAPGGSTQLPGGGTGLVHIFDDRNSSYQKGFQKWLRDEQKQRVEKAEAARQAFQRTGLIGAIVAGFERTAALTAAQCDEFASLLADDLPKCGATDMIDWRLGCLARVPQLPEERLRAIIHDIQGNDVQQQWTRITAAARHYRMLVHREAQLPGRVQRPDLFVPYR